MAGKRASYPLRIDPAVLNALRHWADDELRSVNAQIDFIIRKALKDAGRLPDKRPAEKEEKPPDRDD